MLHTFLSIVQKLLSHDPTFLSRIPKYLVKVGLPSSVRSPCRLQKKFSPMVGPPELNREFEMLMTFFYDVCKCVNADAFFFAYFNSADLESYLAPLKATYRCNWTTYSFLQFFELSSGSCPPRGDQRCILVRVPSTPVQTAYRYIPGLQLPFNGC